MVIEVEVKERWSNTSRWVLLPEEATREPASTPRSNRGCYSPSWRGKNKDRSLLQIREVDVHMVAAAAAAGTRMRRRRLGSSTATTVVVTLGEMTTTLMMIRHRLPAAARRLGVLSSAVEVRTASGLGSAPCARRAISACGTRCSRSLRGSVSGMRGPKTEMGGTWWRRGPAGVRCAKRRGGSGALRRRRGRRRMWTNGGWL